MLKKPRRRSLRTRLQTAGRNLAPMPRNSLAKIATFCPSAEPQQRIPLPTHLRRQLLTSSLFGPAKVKDRRTTSVYSQPRLQIPNSRFPLPVVGRIRTVSKSEVSTAGQDPDSYSCIVSERWKSWNYSTRQEDGTGQKDTQLQPLETTHTWELNHLHNPGAPGPGLRLQEALGSSLTRKCVCSVPQ